MVERLDDKLRNIKYGAKSQACMGQDKECEGTQTGGITVRQSEGDDRGRKGTG